MSDLNKLKKFLNDDYRVAYLDSHVKGGVAYQIQALREKLGLNQTDFGVLVGMPQTVISRLENAEGGGVNINTLLKIANGLKIGLAVKFCDFSAILAEDVSPAGLSVETIASTISRASGGSTAIPGANTATTHRQPTLEGTRTWQTKLTNQPEVQSLQGSGTPNFGIFILTQASPAYPPSISL